MSQIRSKTGNRVRERVTPEMVLDRAYAYCCDYVQGNPDEQIVPYSYLSARYGKMMSVRGLDLLSSLKADPRFTVSISKSGKGYSVLPHILGEREREILERFIPGVTCSFQEICVPYKGSGLTNTDMLNSLTTLLQMGLLIRGEAGLGYRLPPERPIR